MPEENYFRPTVFRGRQDEKDDGRKENPFEERRQEGQNGHKARDNQNIRANANIQDEMKDKNRVANGPLRDALVYVQKEDVKTRKVFQALGHKKEETKLERKEVAGRNRILFGVPTKERDDFVDINLVSIVIFSVRPKILLGGKTILRVTVDVEGALIV